MMSGKLENGWKNVRFCVYETGEFCKLTKGGWKTTSILGELEVGVFCISHWWWLKSNCYCLVYSELWGVLWRLWKQKVQNCCTYTRVRHPREAQVLTPGRSLDRSLCSSLWRRWLPVIFHFLVGKCGRLCMILNFEGGGQRENGESRFDVQITLILLDVKRYLCWNALFLSFVDTGYNRGTKKLPTECQWGAKRMFSAKESELL